MAFLLQRCSDPAEAAGLVLGAREAAIQAALARALRRGRFGPQGRR